jgi:hypothetical protein
MKNYCTQNDGICRTCSLVNYGRDCQNNPLTTEDDLYLAARERIDGMNFTPYQVDFIWADWPNWEEHLTWLLAASWEEIIDWIDANK